MACLGLGIWKLGSGFEGAFFQEPGLWFGSVYEDSARGGCINMLRESGDWVVCFSAINIFCSAFSSNCIFQI